MIAAVAGFVLGFVIGSGCQWFELPLPAPERIVGALLVIFMTSGYLATDWIIVS